MRANRSGTWPRRCVLVIASSFMLGCGAREIAPGPYVVGPDTATIAPLRRVTASGPLLELQVALPEDYACEWRRDRLFVRRPDGALVTVSAAVVLSNRTRVALSRPGAGGTPCTMRFDARLPVDLHREIARVELTASGSMRLGALSWWSGKPQKYAP